MPIGISRLVSARFFLALFVLFIAQARLAASDEREVILTIHLGNGAEQVTFTDEDLLALDQQSFTTSTLWTSEPQEFSGPSLTSVLNQAGIEAPFALELVAANDYAVTLGPKMIDKHYPIVANRIDGARFGIRNKGPLWLLYPFDLEPEYKKETHFSASIWQLTDIKLIAPQDGASIENQ